MVPQESGLNQPEVASGYANAHAHRDVLQARLSRQDMVKLK